MTPQTMREVRVRLINPLKDIIYQIVVLTLFLLRSI